MKEQTTWVLVADQTQARILSHEKPDGDLTLVKGGALAGNNLPGREIISDRPGRTFDSTSPGRHAKEPPTNPRQQQKQDFVSSLAARLDDEAKKSKFDRLIVVAPPAALGLLRSQLSRRVRDRVATEVGLDLVHLTEHELTLRLADVIKYGKA